MSVQLIVQSNGDVQDPRELHTILIHSLRDLFGDLEPHSCSVVVDTAASGKDFAGKFRVSCREESASQVRAALTWVTPPPYLEKNVYRFDVVDVIYADEKAPH
jgi:RNase P/RNase MRP subunit POP5